MEARIEALRPEALAEMAEVINESGRGQPLYTPVTAELLRVGIMEDPDYDPDGSFLARDGAKPVAAGLASRPRGEGARPHGIVQIAVVPEARGSGIGRALMERLLARCREWGASEAVMSAYAGSDWKLALASELGFERANSNFRMAWPSAAPPPKLENVDGITFASKGLAEADGAFVSDFLAAINASFAESASHSPMGPDQLEMLGRMPGVEARLFVARALDGRPAGACLAIMERRDGGTSGDINIVGVQPPYRRTGVARALMSSAIAWLVGRGAPEATLSVDGRNARAVALYRKMGFEVRSEAIALRRRL